MRQRFRPLWKEVSPEGTKALFIGELIYAEIVPVDSCYSLFVNGKKYNDYFVCERAMDEGEEIIFKYLKEFDRIRFIKRQEIELMVGKIEDDYSDIIVFPNSTDLSCSSGASKSIADRAGEGFRKDLEEAIGSTKEGYLSPGQICVSRPHNIKCRALVSAIGPVWEGGTNNEELCLQSCYSTALSFAGIEVKSISFASISTGGNRYPINLAARAAIAVFKSYLAITPDTKIERIRVILNDDEAMSAFRKALDHANTGVLQ